MFNFSLEIAKALIDLRVVINYDGDLADDIKAVLNQLDPSDRLHTMKVVNALVKHEVLESDQKAEAMEVLKPVLGQIRDELKKQQTLDLEPMPDTSVTIVTQTETPIKAKEYAMVKTFTNIPLPTRQTRGKYPWETLEEGHSFFVPGGKDKVWYTQCSAKGKALGKKFIARKYTLEEQGEEPVEGIMVWRVA